MQAKQLIDYEITLLLAKHGEKRVICSLAGKLGLSPGELERRLGELHDLRPKRSVRSHLDPTEAVESVAAKNPDKAACLRLLGTRFQNRTFLPELKDVRRLLERHSHTLGNVRSRAQAAPRLFRLLASLDSTELETLCEAGEGPDYSSLGIIADQIMRPDKG